MVSICKLQVIRNAEAFVALSVASIKDPYKPVFRIQEIQPLLKRRQTVDVVIMNNHI